MSEGQRTVYIVPHTHWDREWYMPHELFRWRLTQMIDALLDHMEEHPEYRCFNLDGQSIVIDDYLALRPESRDRLRKLIEAGRILIGPWWVQPDEWLPSAESHVRNLQLGIREAEAIGGCMMIGHCADQFGHIAQLPQIFAELELTSACLWRGVGDEVPGWSFWWGAPDGTRLPVLYLRHSYSNGLNLPADREELLARVREAEGERRPEEPALLMNGSDHTFFEPGVPTLIAQGLDGYSLKLASLAEYEQAMFDAGIDEYVHPGELRSPDRSNILTGVLSARMNLKQRDFDVSAALERYAEPLELLAHIESGYDGLAALKHAWRVFLENAPHDSICGCSIDQTHREMLPRYDRAEQLALRVADEAMAALSPALAAGDGALAVFRPVAGQSTPFRAHVPAGWGAFALAFAEVEVPVAYGAITPGEVLSSRPIAVEAAIRHIDAAARGTVNGRRVQRITLEETPAGLELTTVVGDGIAVLDFAALRQRLREAGRVERSITHTVRTEDLVAVEGVLPPAPGIELILLRRSAGAPVPMYGTAADGPAISNEHYRVELGAGALDIVDLVSGDRFAGINRYVVEGDRGDEYNADITGDVVLAEEIAFLDSNANGVRAMLRYRTMLQVSQRLAPDRERREGESQIEIDTTVTLWTGLRRVDLEVTVTNAAEDLRLRSAFPLPFRIGLVATEAHFYIADRRVAAPEWNGRSAERPTSTFPQKTFAAMGAAGSGIAVFNRGLPEGEVVEQDGGQAYALTLLRAVGWLSRPDLRTRDGGAGPTLRTLDSQMPGTHRFDYAWTSYEGTWQEARIQEAAHAFAHPPRAWAAAGATGQAERFPVIEVDGATFSAVHRSHLDGARVVRVYHASAEPGRMHVKLAGAGLTIQRTNLLERHPEPIERDGPEGWSATLRPWEIATFRAQ